MLFLIYFLDMKNSVSFKRVGQSKLSTPGRMQGSGGVVLKNYPFIIIFGDILVGKGGIV